LQAQGSDFVPPQVFMLDPTEQETVTREVTVPDTAPATFQVLVSSFNSQGIEVFRGDTTVAFGQTSAVVTLARTALLPVPATPANLQQMTFFFTDGAVFGLPNMPVTLATGMFEGNRGDFALTANGLVASGSVVVGSCTFVITTSTFPPEQGLQVGDQLILDPCQVDAIDRRLIATNAIVRLTDTSNPPVGASPDTTLNLPTPSTLVIDENTSGTLQIAASINGTRPASLTLGITIPPAHGTATLTNTGVVTYRPVTNFNGSDRLVVTVVVSFTDNNSPSLLLGTVVIPITVRPVNHAPAPTALGIRTPQNTPGTTQISANDPDAGQTPMFSVSTPPAHGVATISPSGLVTYTPAPGFSGADRFEVTVTDNGTPPRLGTVTITVTVKSLFGTDASGGNLLTIDPATGIGTVIGSMGIGAVPALALDPTTGIMYAATGGGNPNLYQVDPSTAATTVIGSTGLGLAAVSDLAFSVAGTLYAAVNILGDGGTGADNLATIDKTTGKAIIIGPFDGSCTQSPCEIEGMEALAFDTAGNLFGALSERGAGGTPGLYKINPATATAAFFAPILDANGTPPSGGIVSLQFCGGILFGGTARAVAAIDGIPTPTTDGGRLIIIDPATGLLTFVGSVSATSGSSLGALACQ
jgi:hypothetical protein